MDFKHKPVLLDETIDMLKINSDGIYVDGTAGGGGHSGEILARLKNGRLIAIDQDPDAILTLNEKFRKAPNVTVIQDNFSNIEEILKRLNIGKVNGILLDIGVSSYQLDSSNRGFSYNKEAPLDMRMSKQGTSAYDLVNRMEAKELANIIYRYGEEKFSYRIANKIVEAREKKPIETTTQLSEIIKEALPQSQKRKQGHPAKKTFQAIRIAVNDELDVLQRGLASAVDSLEVGGRLAIITFHSLEDRIVKQRFNELAKGCICPPDFPVCVCGHKQEINIINKRPIVATPEELEVNRRSKSAKLRVCEKLEV